MMVEIVQMLAGLVLGFTAGALTMWWFLDTDDARTVELMAREDALRTRLRDVEALLNVPPLFWKIWDRYTIEHAQLLLEEFLNSSGAGSTPDKPDSGKEQDSTNDDEK